MVGIRVEERPWDTLPDGTPLSLFDVSDGHGFGFSAAAYGAALTGLNVPDRDGRSDDVIVGFKSAGAALTPAAYAARPCFGSIVGRYANRIAGACFTIDGTTFRFAPNDSSHLLHGGLEGFDRRGWTGRALNDGVRFELVSPAGDEGFPGRLDVIAEYRISGPRALTLSIRARTDAPTHVNIAGHPYFNLAGQSSASIEDHRLMVESDAVLAIDRTAIPLGMFPVDGTPFDLRAPRRVGDLLASPHPQIVAGDGFNHCFVMRGRRAVLADPASGRRLTLTTDQPGLQLYTANAFDGSLRDGFRPAFARRQAIALEAQHFPDSPNRPDFPATLLRPGETFVSTTTFGFDA